MMDPELSEETLQDLYAWIDKISLSRPKRHITRDFSDGVMAAEVVKHFFPKLVELHNYSPASSTHQKISNWNTLNRKVFSKLNFNVREEAVSKIVLSTPGVIEPVLCSLRQKIEQKLDHTGDNDLEYYSTKNQEKPLTETRQDHGQDEGRVRAAMRVREDRKIDENMTTKAGKPQLSSIDPAVRLILAEKEQAVMALQETVEILQMKVNRLEHLVHLKDMRIEDLTRHLETYKVKAKHS